MLLWNTIHFASIGLTTGGALLQALFASSFKVKDEHLYVWTDLARVATKVPFLGLWIWALGIVFLLCYEIHLLQIG